MKLTRFFIVVAALLPLLLNPAAASATSLTCDPAHLAQCPKPGTYRPYTAGQHPPLIARDGTFELVWASSFIEPPPAGQVPQWWRVSIRYTNLTNADQGITCVGASDPALSKEWFYRDGKQIGYVPASQTFCSDHPNFVTAIPPHGSRLFSARFHNVPWVGDRISIEWAGYNQQTRPRSPFVNPYATR
jgi:hypothetical protein